MAPPYQTYPPRDPLPQPARATRPSAWWWAVPAAFFVAGAAIFVLVLLPVTTAPFHTDVSVPFDGIQHEAVLKSTGDKEIWVPQGTLVGFGCLVRDAPSNRTITLQPLSASLTRTVHGQREIAVYRFSPISTHILIVCVQPGPNPAVLPDIQVGPRVGVSAFGGTVGTLVLIVALLGLGAVATLALIILFATRQPRQPLQST